MSPIRVLVHRESGKAVTSVRGRGKLTPDDAHVVMGVPDSGDPVENARAGERQWRNTQAARVFNDRRQ